MTDSKTQSERRFIATASIRHAHGVKGEVKIVSLTTPPEDFAVEPLCDQDGKPVTITITGKQPTCFICRITGVTDRSQAEALKGTQLGFMRSASDERTEDEIYASDLIGLVVVDEHDRVIGTLQDIVNYGASDIAVIETESGNLMIPYAHTFFPQDPENGRIHCRMPETITAPNTSEQS
jgi:16S rRNA processing protein RimM